MGGYLSDNKEKKEIILPNFFYENEEYLNDDIAILQYSKGGPLSIKGGRLKEIKNDFQEEEPYAPDNTVSLKIIKKNKTIGGKTKKITQKIFTLDNGAQHIVEIEEN